MTGAEALLEALECHRPGDDAEAEHCRRMAEFVRQHPRPFDRAHLHGHLTASAIVVDADGDHVLMGYHRKLGRWLQLGGHGEPGDLSAEAVALREATEESGIEGLVLHGSAPRPLDVDIHPIPARGDVPAHEHLDLRFLVAAPAGVQPVHRPDEHHEVRWFAWSEIDGANPDASLRRALGKAARILGHASALDFARRAP